MKITRSQLRKLIEESLALTEAEYSEGDILYYDEDSDGTPDDNYEYKSEKGVWYTRRRGTSGRWISLSASKYKSSTDKLDALYPKLAIDRYQSLQDEPAAEEMVPSISNTAAKDGIKEIKDKNGNVLLMFNTDDSKSKPRLIYVYPGIGSSTYGEQPDVLRMISLLRSRQILI